jgi:ABC-type lipoprotein release transport system permease subunit
MGKYIKLAWRNTWRNWRRTLIASAAFVLSLILLLFFQAFLDGFDQAVYGNLIRLYGGNVLIHTPGYREKSSRLPMLPLEEAEAILAAVRAEPNVRSAARRINTGGLISNHDASQAVNITAIEPLIEGPVSLAAENITLGRFLTAEDGDNIVIGQALADHLGVTVGDRVSLLGRRKDDSMRGRTMTVVGIFDLGLGEAEKGLVFINLPTAQTLYNLRDQETEIAVILDEVGQEEALIDAIAPQFPNHEVDSLFTLRPEFRQAMEMDRIMQWFIGIITLFMAAIGVFNLMLMAVFERTREMGVLAALGMKRGQVMGLFLLEGASIGLVGAILGCAAGWLLVVSLAQQGIGWGSIEGLEQAGEIYALMGDRLYPHIAPLSVVYYGLAAVVVGALGAFYPAWQASGREPADSLHFE